MGTKSLKSDDGAKDLVGIQLRTYSPESYEVYAWSLRGFGEIVAEEARKAGHSLKVMNVHGHDITHALIKRKIAKIDVCLLFHDPADRDDDVLKVFHVFKRTRPFAVANRILCGPHVVSG